MTDIPPFFDALGKSSRDLFKKGYDFPKIRLNLKTKTESGVEFETDGSHDLNKCRTTGSLQTKLKFPTYGLTFTETWSTTADLNAELNFEPKKVQGLKLTLVSNWTPSSGTKSAKVKASYSREKFAVDADTDIQVTGPIVRASAVFMHKGWYGGYQIGYSPSDSRLTANDAVVGYNGGDFTVHSSLSNLSDCMASVYHKVSNKTEVGLQSTYNVQTGNPTLALASKYTSDTGEIFRGKVNNKGEIGIGYTQKINSVKVTLSSLVEGQNISTGGHKLGVSLEFES